MLNKLPILLIILVIIFLITSLFSFIMMEKVVTPERVEVKKPQTSTAAGIVQVSIANPGYEKEEGNNGAGI